MAEITFYVLPTASVHERYVFACKLIEKAYRTNGQPCYVLTDSPAQSGRIDDLLWTFRAGSFIPHQLYQDDQPINTHQKVLIGSQLAPQGWHQLIINLSTQAVTQDSKRVLEILDNSESTKAAGRLRYRHYQQAGDNISTHKL